MEFVSYWLLIVLRSSVWINVNVFIEDDTKVLKIEYSRWGRQKIPLFIAHNVRLFLVFLLTFFVFPFLSTYLLTCHDRAFVWNPAHRENDPHRNNCIPVVPSVERTPSVDSPSSFHLLWTVPTPNSVPIERHQRDLSKSLFSLRVPPPVVSDRNVPEITSLRALSWVTYSTVPPCRWSSKQEASSAEKLLAFANDVVVADRVEIPAAGRWSWPRAWLAMTVSCRPTGVELTSEAIRS